MNSDARLYHAIFTGQPAVNLSPQPPAITRQPGAIATIVRVFNGLEYGRLSIHVMSRDEQGICLRSPIGLIPGAIYRLSLGSDPDNSTLIQTTAFRLRGDGTYDVGAREIANNLHSRAAA
ncbi:MAG TPA: hypothetical protein VH370_22345 [Humisphaera sp.]|jgi:hypothetical protein|nr:hypothetical protein [Humisphaera sp.]